MAAGERHENPVLFLLLDEVPIELNNLRTTSYSQWTLLYNTLDRLVDLDGEGKAAPGIASEWSRSEDGRTYLLKLRPDFTFHDGTPLTAEHARRSLLRSIEELDHTYGGLAEHVDCVVDSHAGECDAIAAVEEYVLKIRTRRSDDSFLQLLNLNENALTIEDRACTRSPCRRLGSGLYGIVSVAPGEIRLRANRHHPEYSERLFQNVSVLALPEEGGSDGFWDLPTVVVSKGSAGLKLSEFPPDFERLASHSGTTVLLTLNGTDREQLAYLRWSFQEALTSVSSFPDVSPTASIYPDRSPLHVPAYYPAVARPDKLPKLRLRTPPGLVSAGLRTAVAVALANYGVPVEWLQMAQQDANGEVFGIYIDDVQDPAKLVHGYFNGSWSYARSVPHHVSELISIAQRSNGARSQEALELSLRLLLSDTTIVPLFYMPNLVVVNSRNVESCRFEARGNTVRISWFHASMR